METHPLSAKPGGKTGCSSHFVMAQSMKPSSHDCDQYGLSTPWVSGNLANPSLKTVTRNIVPSLKRGSSGCDTNLVHYSIIIMDLCEYLGMTRQNFIRQKNKYELHLVQLPYIIRKKKKILKPPMIINL